MFYLYDILNYKSVFSPLSGELHQQNLQNLHLLAYTTSSNYFKIAAFMSFEFNYKKRSQ